MALKRLQPKLTPKMEEKIKEVIRTSVIEKDELLKISGMDNRINTI